MADSMEMMILAIIGPALHCAWHLSEWDQTILTVSVFLGKYLIYYQIICKISASHFLKPD